LWSVYRRKEAKVLHRVSNVFLYKKGLVLDIAIVHREIRSIPKSVKLTPSEYALLKKTIPIVWKGIRDPSASELICTLAVIGAKHVLEEKS
jgi:hypothetical protein